MSEYRIRINYPAPYPPGYATNVFRTRGEAEEHLKLVNEQNIDAYLSYTVVYGVYYAETNGFAEQQEPSE